MRRIRAERAGLVLMGTVLVLLGTGVGASASRPRPMGGAAAWQVHTIVSTQRSVLDVRLAVSERGQAVLGWVQGRPPVVCSQGPCRQPGGPWRGFRVMAAQGTAAGGFGRPIEVSAHGYGHVFVAQLSSGVSYLAWDPAKGAGWRIVAIHRDRVFKPTVLPANAQLQGLFTGRRTEAAAVWSTPGNPAWGIHYAFLGPRGRLRRQGNLALIRHGTFFTYPSIAVNDRGQLAAVWARAVLSNSTAFLAMCDARGRCTQPRPLAVPNATPNLTVALTDSGAAVALVGAHSGLWAVIAHVDRPGVRSVRVASAAVGASPIAVPEGRAGVAVTFNPSPDSVAWTFLNPSTGRFVTPAIRPARAGAQAPQVAASLSRRFVLSWSSSSGLRASTGKDARAGHGRSVPASHDAGQPNFNPYDGPDDGYIGIDGRGDALLAWEHGTHGLIEAVHLAR